MFFLRQKPAAMHITEAVQKLANGLMTVIDVREHAEVSATGKAAGAIHIPLMRLADMADPRHPDFHPALKDCGEIGVYCASGGRSQNAEMILRKLGYDNVLNLGGLSHWQQAGGPVEAA